MISAIIPAYNASTYIEQCICSIASAIVEAGMDEDFVEVIVVNDGSTDETPHILDLLKTRYPFLKVINKNNGGVSAARNEGLKIAKGDYIHFIDADDSITVDFYKVLFPYLTGTYEVLLFGYYAISSKVTSNIYRGDSKNLLEKYLKGYIKVNIWSSIYKRGIVQNNRLFFDEHTYYGEDREFVTKALALSQNTIYIKEALYNYNMQNVSSAINSTYTSKRFTSIIVDLRVFEYLKSRRCSQGVLKAAKNQVLFNYYYNRRIVLSLTDNQLKKDFGCYHYLAGFTPPLQLSKFWFYNIFYWILGKIYD